MSLRVAADVDRRHPGPRPKSELLRWLREENPEPLAELWRLADETRRAHVGDAVHLRGLIEFSNVCGRDCLYCGIRRSNSSVPRSRP